MFLVVLLSLCYSLSVHGFNQIFILCVNRFALHFHRRGDLPILGMELLVKNSELSNIFHPGQLIIDLVDLFLDQFLGNPQMQNSKLNMWYKYRGQVSR